MAEAERGMDLTSSFESMWKDTISKDRTCWLLPASYGSNPDDYWKSMIEPIRQGVLAAYEPALDRAFDAIAQNMLKSKSKEEVVAFWMDQYTRHPKLVNWLRTQVHLLTAGAGPNLLSNGDFEKETISAPRNLKVAGTAGPSNGDSAVVHWGGRPTIPGWIYSGSWQGIPSDYSCDPNTGRNGTSAAGLGCGYTGSISTTAATLTGHRYRLSVWYKTNAPRPRISGGVSGARLGFTPVAGEWRQAVTTFTAPGSGTTITLSADGMKRGEWTWFDDVQVVEISSN